MTFHDKDMSREEIYGTLLRERTDELVQGVDDFETRLDFVIRRAEAFAAALAVCNEITDEILAQETEATRE